MNQKEIDNLQLVLAELLSDDEEPKIRLINNKCYQYSNISIMFANMINKGIYSIDKVPTRYIEEVDSILKNKED